MSCAVAIGLTIAHPVTGQSATNGSWKIEVDTIAAAGSLWSVRINGYDIQAEQAVNEGDVIEVRRGAVAKLHVPDGQIYLGRADANWESGRYSRISLEALRVDSGFVMIFDDDFRVTTPGGEVFQVGSEVAYFARPSQQIELLYKRSGGVRFAGRSDLDVARDSAYSLIRNESGSLVSLGIAPSLYGKTWFAQGIASNLTLFQSGLSPIQIALLIVGGGAALTTLSCVGDFVICDGPPVVTPSTRGTITIAIPGRN